MYFSSFHLSAKKKKIDENYQVSFQSDILHQPLFEMIHSEDREDIKLQLSWNYNVPIHVTCLQDILTPSKK